MAESKVSLGQAIDQIITALQGLDQNGQVTAISAACHHLKIPMSPGNQPDSKHQVKDKPDAANKRDSITGKPVVNQTDIRSLKEEKDPESAKQMACLVAYYLDELAPVGEQKQTVNNQDIEKYFKQAGFKLPKHPDQVLPDAKRSGYFESSAKGGYKLNAVGYNLVVHGLPAKKKGS
jgi:hypothetical protein